MRRPIDERAAADLFFADLTGRSMRRLPHGRSGESIAFAEQVVPSSVLNPGWQSWMVIAGSMPSKQKPPPWAGAIRQQSDAFSDYTGWERKSEVFTLEQQKPGIGFVLDFTTFANVKGRHKKGPDDAFYVTDATVMAAAPRNVSPSRRMLGTVDVHVGLQDKNRKLYFVKASWDRDKGCARLDIPVRVSFSRAELIPDQFVITWFGNGDVERSPLVTP